MLLLFQSFTTCQLYIMSNDPEKWNRWIEEQELEDLAAAYKAETEQVDHAHHTHRKR